MKTTYYNGYPIYEDITTRFNYGDIYYIDEPYTCTKEDLDKVNTKYMAGRRKEIILSGQNFNANNNWRYTAPISTYHDNTFLTESKILFRDNRGVLSVINLDQMRSRSLSDMRKGSGSEYVCTMCDEVMNIITSKLKDYLTDINVAKFEPFINNPVYNKIDDLERKIENLENIINNKAHNELQENNNSEMVINKKSSSGGRTGLYDSWPLEKKTEFKNDVLEGMGHTDLMIKYDLASSTISRYTKAIKNGTFKK